MAKKKKKLKPEKNNPDCGPHEIVQTGVIVANPEPEVHEAKTFIPTYTFGRPPKFDNVEDLKQRIADYFAMCDPHIENIEVPLFLDKQRMWTVDKQLVRTTQRPYTVSGLALYLGTNRTVLLDYEEAANKNPETLPLHLQHKDTKILRDFSNTIKEAKAKIEEFVEQRLSMGGHPAGPIFNLKNNFKRWEDKTIVDNPGEAALHEKIEEVRQMVASPYKSLKQRKK